MTKKISAFALFSFSFFFSFSQTDSVNVIKAPSSWGVPADRKENDDDQLSPAKINSDGSRKASHYLGVQANLLVRQLLNFSNTSTTIDNPYLISYAVNSKSTGVGFTSGIGFTINEFSDGDQTSKRNTKINNLSFRVGFEKKSMIGKKWMVSWGFDVIRDDFKNETSNTQSFDLQNPSVKSVSTSTNSTSSWGFGPRFALNFQITDRILLGTEANYYYKSGSNSTKAATSSTFFDFDQFGNKTLVTRSTDTPESSTDFTKFQFVLPTVLYLIVKF